MRNKVYQWVLALLLCSSSSAFAKFSYEGILTDSSGVSLDIQSVQFQIQILNPASSCVLYQETHNLITGIDGYFSLVAGAGSRVDVGSYPFNQVFQNVFNKVFRHVFGQVFRHVFRQVFKHVFQQCKCSGRFFVYVSR